MFNWFKKKNTEVETYSNEILNQIRGIGQGEIAVNETTAQNLVSVYACIRAIAETLASLPFPVYRRLGRGKDKFRDHPAFRILNVSPDDEIPAMNWRETGLSHLLSWGNWFNEIERTKGGELIAVHLLSPKETEVSRNKAGKIEYKTKGSLVPIPADRMLHVSGLGFDGLKGCSPIKMGKSAIQLGMATEKFGLKWFMNGSRGQGVISTPNKLSDKARENLRASIEAVHGGVENSHKFLFFEEGMKMDSIGVPPEDAQFLSTRQFQLQEICRLFRISPVVVQDLSRSTFSNNEQEMISFVVHTLRPWCRRIENQINWRLLGNEPDLFAEHTIDGLLRGDLATRYNSYAIARQWGWMSADDVCELENRNPLPEEQGTIYLCPLNMSSAKKFLADEQKSLEAAPEKTEETAEETKVEPAEQPKEEAAQLPIGNSPEALKASLNVVRDNLDRMFRRESEAILKASRKPKEFLNLVDLFYKNHESILKRALQPSIDAFSILSGNDIKLEKLTSELIQSGQDELLELSGTCKLDELPEAIANWQKQRSGRSEEIIRSLSI